MQAGRVPSAAAATALMVAHPAGRADAAVSASTLARLLWQSLLFLSGSQILHQVNSTPGAAFLQRPLA